jgi:hypothetical protein
VAQIWFRDEAKTWKPVGLVEGPLELGAGEAGSGVAVCRAHGNGAAGAWVLVCGPKRSTRLNGLLLHTGIRVLADRDEIKVDTDPPVFFSTEELARAETFAGGDREIKCPRCKKPVQDGAQVVRCPVCQLTYHHSENKERDCWGYAAACACGHSTAMDAGYRWTPQDMWE